MADQENYVEKLEIYYTLLPGGKDKNREPRQHEEKLLLDRNTHMIINTTTISSCYQITNSCYIVDGVAKLLDQFAERLIQTHRDDEPIAPDEFDIPQYEMILYRKDGTEQRISGIFDSLGLPTGWNSFIEAVLRYFTAFQRSDILSLESAEERYHRAEDLIVCEVYVRQSTQLLTYLAHESFYDSYDTVIVPVGPNNEEKLAIIDSVQYCKKSELRLPFEKLKYIIRKVCNEEEKMDEVIVCHVHMKDSKQTYTYLADEDIYDSGDTVIVPVGSENEEKLAIIDSVQYYHMGEIMFPFRELKYIIRKVANKEDE